MCGRYTLRVKLNLLLDQFAAELAYESEYDAHNIARDAAGPGGAAG
jgi:hypothetical protein